MNKPTNILIDQAFHDKFDAFETSFQPGDWDAMQFLLESDRIPLVLPPNKHLFTNLKHTLIMILLTLATSGMLWFSTPEEIVELPTAVHTIQTSVTAPTKQLVSTDAVMHHAMQPDEAINNDVSPTEVNTLTPDINIGTRTHEIATVTLGLFEENVGELEEVLIGPDTAKFLKTVTSRYWVDTTYTYRSIKPSRDIEEGWFGVYYTNQELNDANLWQDTGMKAETHGFNLQFMSGNLLPGEDLAIYGGFDWGMQFYGRSKNSEVLINSGNEDRGLTYLRRHSNDIFFTGQVEWAQFRIVPYITGSVGTRILTTGQTTRALLASTEYESTQDNGVQTRAALAGKVGVGVKVKISPRVFFDARYELTQSGTMQTVDYNNSGFNGLDYDLGFKDVNLNADHLRFGFVFDVSSEQRNKTVDVPGHWEETTQTLYVDPSDSTKVFVPCPCDKPKTKRSSSNSNRSRHNGGNKRFPGSDGGIFTPGSGSGKGDFPGLKKPPVRW